MQIGSIQTTNNLRFNSDNSYKVQENKAFSDILKDMISEVDNYQKQADISNYLLITNQAQSLHDVVIDSQKADIALQLTLQIRNKVVEAYQEIMRMQF